jgi:hypothetical protein
MSSYKGTNQRKSVFYNDRLTYFAYKSSLGWHLCARSSTDFRVVCTYKRRYEALQEAEALNRSYRAPNLAYAVARPKRWILFPKIRTGPRPGEHSTRRTRY